MSIIAVTKHAAWAHLRIKRAEKRNALDQAAGLELLVALRGRAIGGAVVLTGAEPWFCSGADIKERAQLAADGKPDPTGAEGIELAIAIHAFPGVVIAAVNGLALGYGVNLVNCCDLALARYARNSGSPNCAPGRSRACWWRPAISRVLTANCSAGWSLARSLLMQPWLRHGASLTKWFRTIILRHARASWPLGLRASIELSWPKPRLGTQRYQDVGTDWRRAMEEGQRMSALIKSHA